LALELISHMDGRVDHDNTTQFIAAYQTVTPLMLGELWAFPIMLQLALAGKHPPHSDPHRVSARGA
jgi:Ser/Thr protein kinase RdoA (MazF antagonist)